MQDGGSGQCGMECDSKCHTGGRVTRIVTRDVSSVRAPLAIRLCIQYSGGEVAIRALHSFH